MATQHVVVDGSNIATEGRSTPSLAQLEAAVAELRKELPEAEVTIVVDATFAHRIDGSELERFEQAALRGEYVYPPAGAIGRGDAFLLRIAERVDGIVLSNDSFQEFHGEHEWLFERGRLLGATPVPGVGWIFVPRTPVRGPRSRVAVRDAHRAKERVVKAIAQATKEVVEPAPSAGEPKGSRRARGRASEQSPQAVNDPMTFISFIAEHPLGEELEGVVDSFTSHGAVVHFGEVRCYVPLSGLGNPAPRSAREVLRRGEPGRFVVTALDPLRRGVELALPGIGVVSGRPSEETVAAEVRMARAPSKKGDGVPVPASPGRRRGTGATAAAQKPPVVGATTRRGALSGGAAASPAEKAASRASTGRAATEATKAAPTKAAPKQSVPTKAAPTKAAATKAAATKAAATKAAATKAAPTKAAPTKAAPKQSVLRKAAAVEAVPAVTAPSRAAPKRAAAAKSTPTRHATAASAPSKASATKAAPSKSTPTKAAPAKLGAAKTASERAVPAKSAPRTSGTRGAAAGKTGATRRSSATASVATSPTAATPAPRRHPRPS